jgi:microcompartment protein CcmK/EutM
MQGWRLLVVQPLDKEGADEGEPMLAIDYLGAGAGDRAILSNDGAAARHMIGSNTSPVRWFVMGIADRGTNANANS